MGMGSSWLARCRFEQMRGRFGWPKACATASPNPFAHERNHPLQPVCEQRRIRQTPDHARERQGKNHIEGQFLSTRSPFGLLSPQQACIEGRRGIPGGHFGGANGAAVVAVLRTHPHSERARPCQMTCVKGRGLRQRRSGEWGMQQSGFTQVGAKSLPTLWLGA